MTVHSSEEWRDRDRNDRNEVYVHSVRMLRRMGYFSWLCQADESLQLTHDEAACDEWLMIC